MNELLRAAIVLLVVVVIGALIGLAALYWFGHLVDSWRAVR